MCILGLGGQLLGPWPCQRWWSVSDFLPGVFPHSDGEEGGEWMGFKGMLRSFLSQPLVPAGPVSLGISSRISHPLPAGRSEGLPCKCCVSLSCCLIPTSIYIFEKRGGRDLKNCFKLMKTAPLRWALLPQQQILPEFFFLHFYYLFMYFWLHFPINPEFSGNR